MKISWQYFQQMHETPAKLPMSIVSSQTCFDKSQKRLFHLLNQEYKAPIGNREIKLCTENGLNSLFVSHSLLYVSISFDSISIIRFIKTISILFLNVHAFFFLYAKMVGSYHFINITNRYINVVLFEVWMPGPSVVLY